MQKTLWNRRLLTAGVWLAWIFSISQRSLPVFGTENSGSGVALAQTGPVLQIPEALPAVAGSQVDVPINFVPSGHRINATSFWIAYDTNCLLFNPVDANRDNLLDNVRVGVTGFTTTTLFNPETRVLSITLWAFSTALPQNTLATVKFQVTCTPTTVYSGVVGFATEPAA